MVNNQNPIPIGEPLRINFPDQHNSPPSHIGNPMIYQVKYKHNLILES